MNDVAARIGKRIRELRHSQGVSLEELAFQAHMNAPHLGQIERGLQNPTIVTLNQICTALGVPIEELFAENESAKPEKSSLAEPSVLSKINAQLHAMTPEQQTDMLKIIRIIRKNIK